MPQDHQIHEGVLYINNVQPSDAGEYSCLGIGPTGTVLFTATARLVVIGELDSLIHRYFFLIFCMHCYSGMPEAVGLEVTLPLCW
jgi:hypothetical protein